MTLKDLQDYMSKKTSDFRSVLNRLDTTDFQSLWEQSTKEQQKEVKTIVMNGDREGLKHWMDTHPALKADDWGYTRLLNRAKTLGVKNYSRLTRNELIQGILEKESGKIDEKD
jgi:hypothetical protein